MQKQKYKNKEKKKKKRKKQCFVQWKLNSNCHRLNQIPFWKNKIQKAQNLCSYCALQNEIILFTQTLQGNKIWHGRPTYIWLKIILKIQLPERATSNLE